MKKSQHVEKSDVSVHKVDTGSKVTLVHVDTTVKKGVTTIKTTTIEIEKPVYITDNGISVGSVSVADLDSGDMWFSRSGTSRLRFDSVWHKGGSKSGSSTFSADRIRAHIVEETTDTSTHLGISDHDILVKDGFTFDSASHQVVEDNSSVIKGGNAWLIYMVIALVIIFLGGLYLLFKRGII